jgi:hypothetical protein
MTDAVQLLFSLLFIGSACAPTLIILAPACVLYFLTQRLYAAPSRDLDRLTAVRACEEPSWIQRDSERGLRGNCSCERY